MSNSNVHNHSPLPVFVAGGAAGQMKGGRHLMYPEDTPMANLLLTILDKAGIPAGQRGRQHRAVDRALRNQKSRSSDSESRGRADACGRRFRAHAADAAEHRDAATAAQADRPARRIKRSAGGWNDRAALGGALERSGIVHSAARRWGGCQSRQSLWRDAAFRSRRGRECRDDRGAVESRGRSATR